MAFAGCDYFIVLDKRLLKFNSDKIKVPDDIRVELMDGSSPAGLSPRRF